MFADGFGWGPGACAWPLQRLTTVATFALFAVIGASPVAAEPTPEPAPLPEPAVPTFVDGLSQAVFGGSATWLNSELWVETDVDSRPRRQARPHPRRRDPRARDADGRPQGAGHLRDQPVLREPRPGPELGRQPRARRSAGHARRRAVLQRRDHEPDDLARSTSRPGCRAASRSCTPSRSAPAAPTAARPRGPQRDRGRQGGRRLAERPRARLHDPRRRRRRSTADWTTGKVGMIGTSYNGTLPIAVASTGVEGLEAIVPISAISNWYDYYRANGMTARAVHLPGRGSRRAGRRGLLPRRRAGARPRTICRG